MYTKILRYMVLTTALALISPTLWADVPPLVAASCVGCHGPGGSSIGPATPSIAEMDKDLFMEMMERYKKDEIPSTIMNRIAKGYSTNDFKAMRDYFINQTFIRYPQKTDPKQVKKGKKLHNKYCKKCHEDDGRKGESGLLAGQWMPYLQFSLADYHSGERKMSKKMNKRVKQMLTKHGEASFDDLIHFYGSQK